MTEFGSARVEEEDAIVELPIMTSCLRTTWLFSIHSTYLFPVCMYLFLAFIPLGIFTLFKNKGTKINPAFRLEEESDRRRMTEVSERRRRAGISVGGWMRG